MAAQLDSPSRGFALSDFTEIPNPPADDTPKAGADGGAAPQIDTAALKTGTIAEPEIKELAEDDPEKGRDDIPESLETAMRSSPDADRKEQERIAAEQKVKDQAAVAEKATKEGESGGKTAAEIERDADLKHDLTTHRAPTRKVITDFQTKAKAARDERDKIAVEKAAIQKERDDLIEKLKTAPASKEVDDELKTLRERVRELDITRDPVLEKKYDSRIKANNDSIINVLKAQGFGMVKGDGEKLVENPQAIAELVKGGLTFKTLNPLLKKLDEADLVDEAEAIRDAIRQNNRLSQERTQEVESWKSDHGRRLQAREQETKQQAEARQSAFTQQTDAQYRAELAALEKDFAYLKQPPAPLSTDTPAVKQAKEAAIAEFTAAAKRIETEVKGLSPDGVPQDKIAEVVGRINSQAILAIALKAHVLPSLKRDLAAARKERDEATAELAKIRDAGRISRLQGQAPGSDPNAGKAEPTSLEDAFRSVTPGS